MQEDKGKEIRLNSEEVEKKLREVFVKLSITKPDENKFAAIKTLLETEGQGYLLES